MSEPTDPAAFPRIDLQNVVAITMHRANGSCVNGHTTNVERRAGAKDLTISWTVAEAHPTTDASPFHRVCFTSKSWTFELIGNVAHFRRTAPDDPALVPADARPLPEAVLYLIVIAPKGRML